MQSYSDPAYRRFLFRRSLQAAGGRCVYCGRDLMSDARSFLSSSLDHVLPRSRGGNNHPENLVAACGPCNRLKDDAFRQTVDEARALIARRLVAADIRRALLACQCQRPLLPAPAGAR